MVLARLPAWLSGAAAVLTAMRACRVACRCGKTSLCKALAGRLPLSRVVGDVAFVCEADGPASTAEPLVLSPTGAKSMIGFVPQFDLLHESLSVSAAALACRCGCVVAHMWCLLLHSGLHMARCARTWCWQHDCGCPSRKTRIGASGSAHATYTPWWRRWRH